MMRASRRAFLKAMGAAAVGTLGPVSFARSQTSDPTITPIEVPLPTIEAALAIAKASPLFQRAITQLQDAGLGFEAESKDVQLASVNGSSVGLVVGHNTSPSPHYGADLALTVDLPANLLTATQFVIGWCLINSLDVASTILDARNPLEVQLSPTRNQELSLTLIKPRTEQQWSFFRPDSPAQRPEELVEVGWPPELPGYPRWHYVGCSEAEWVNNQGVLMYRCTQLTEMIGGAAAQQRSVRLQYVDAPALP